jgi:hypothetical protein
LNCDHLISYNVCTVGKYSCLLLLDNHSPRFASHRYGIGLILRSKRMPAEAQDTYTRMGYLSLSSIGIDWLKKLERRLITLKQSCQVANRLL